MTDILKQVRKKMREQNIPRERIDKAVEAIENTCVACRHAHECRMKGLVKDPFQPKCERWDMVDKI